MEDRTKLEQARHRLEEAQARDRQKERKELPADGQGQPQKCRKDRHQDRAFFHHAKVHVTAAGPERTEECY